MLDLKRLKSFVVVAEEGNIGRAALRLYVSQPALSRRLRELESELGFSLFAPHGRGIRLTGEGRGFLVHCRDLVAHAEALDERARTYARGECGVLRVGASPQMLERLFPELLLRYQPRFPMVDIELSEGASTEHHQRLVDGEIDLAVITPPADARLASRLLPTLALLAAVPIARRADWRESVAVESLAATPVLVLHEGYVSRQIFDSAFRLSNARPRIVLESGAPRTILALAEAGRGIAIIPSTVSVDSRKLHVVPLTHRGETLEIRASLCWNRRQFVASYVAAFIDELVQVATEKLPVFGATSGGD